MLEHNKKNPLTLHKNLLDIFHILHGRETLSRRKKKLFDIAVVFIFDNRSISVQVKWQRNFG